MYHDFFGWVRLILLIFLILLCSMYFIRAESEYQPEPVEEQTDPAQVETPTITPTEAEQAPEPTNSNPTKEITPQVKVTTIAAEPPTEHEYTAEELEMLALVIYQEAGADWCSDETRLMVGTVVMNRIADPRFPDTMHEVVTEERAYGRLHWTGIVWPDRASYPEEAHAIGRAFTIARRILHGERALPEDVVFQSEYIMGDIVAYSDGMYFCR